MVGMVQLVSAPDCGSGYHGFESHYPPFSILFIGLSPSGKAQDFDSCIRWFESNQPRFLFYLIRFLINNGVSPSGKATDSDSVIRRFKSCYPSLVLYHKVSIALWFFILYSIYWR